jgi:DNA helicase IV
MLLAYVPALFGWRLGGTLGLVDLLSPAVLVGFFAAALVLFALLLLELKLTRTIRFVGTQLQAIEGELSRYQDYINYLQGKERAEQLKKLDTVSRSLHHVLRHRVFLRKLQRNTVEVLSNRADELKVFLERFVHEYTRKEIERSKDFFEGRPFDKDQLEAIVKKDTYSLVLASAGSGKTRTLTARIAFTVKHGANSRDILALAYTRSAQEEMRSRLKNEYDIADTKVRTFHSLGRELARRSPNFRTGVADNQQQPEIIRTACDRLRSDRVFAKLLLDFALELQTYEAEEEEFPSREKFYEFLRYQRHVALNGNRVKSIGERDIANFLFVNQVKFEYEAPALWADRNVGYRMYQPDFFLPEYGIWIEHWAVSRQGTVPAWFSAKESVDPSTAYWRGIGWKRQQFQKYRRKLIETYSYQLTENTLIPELTRQLRENHVQLSELSTEEILDRVQMLIPRRDNLNELMFSFISKAKTNGLTIEDVTIRLRQTNWNRKQRVFASLMIRVWREYESLLKEKDMIDFNDMINYALQVAKSSQSGNTIGKYSHILIDEFQDITDPQLELVKCLLSAGHNSTLFCVGDDRQNIFSFAGSNIYNIIYFGKMFPYAEQTVLSTNYRCPKNIVEASNFVANLNKCKVEKNIVPAMKIERSIRMIEKPGSDARVYEDWQHEKAKGLLTHLIRQKRPGEEIMVLSRFNHPLKRLELEFPQNETLGLKFLSIHRAKGMEADYVLLLSCIRGPYGFPSEMIDRMVLGIVQKSHDDEFGKLEEERRLFYVALTRCKGQLYLFTSSNQKSRFVSEVAPFLSNWAEIEQTAN